MARLFAVLGVSLISFSAVFVRMASVTPSTAAFFRCFYALPLLALLWWPRRDRDRRSTRTRWFAVFAGLFLGIDLNVWHHAIEHIGAGLSTVLGNTQIVFVAFLAWIIHRERPSRWAAGLIPVVFVGVVLVSGLGREDAYGQDPPRGVFFGILTGITYSIFLLLLRASNRGLAPSVGPLLDATFGALISSTVLGIAGNDLSFAPHWPAHGWLLLLAIVSQVFGWLMITEALPRLAALETSVLLLLQPMMTVLWGYLLFSEDLSLVQWCGVSLVLGGVGVLSSRTSVRKMPAPREPAILRQDG